jgi:hypothetical protein
LLIGVVLYEPVQVALDGPKLGFVESEIMPDFMDDRGLDLVADLVLGRGVSFQGLLEDEDDVRRGIAVERTPSVQGNAMIKAEQVPGGTEIHIGDDFGGGKVLDQNGHVFDPFPKFLGQPVDRRGDQLFELRPG